MHAGLELLAPAGNPGCLEAALEAGADAVYLGLKALNARRYARNFSDADLEAACGLVHARGKRVHLALNIDVAQGELGAAARALELASRCGVDVVIVRDPAFLQLLAHFPELEVHLSTQAAVAGVAGVQAAAALGVRRVVLARELTLAEIAAASSVEGIETEVFVHGAMCFAVSGRCLVSSWVGGRSGNRGQCTSPCRVEWSLDGRPRGTPLSMHDLSLAHRIDELRAVGVRAVKIEGRSKNPAWVRASVALVRRAIDHGATAAELAAEAERRGATPGRRVTDGYLDGRRSELVDVAGAPADDETTPAAAPPALRAPVVELLDGLDRGARPRRPLEADRVRLDAEHAADFLARIAPRDGAIVEGLTAEGLAALRARFPAVTVIAALPPVLFDADAPAARALVEAARRLDVPVEVNDWAGWQLARAAAARMLAGPGLGVLNALAVRELARRGLEEVTASVEIDARKLEELVDRAELPCAVVVFGRPSLMITRVELPADVAAGELADQRAVSLRARRAGGLWDLRTTVPFDVRSHLLPAGIAHTVVDLVASPDPAAEWTAGPAAATRFNLDRVLS